MTIKATKRALVLIALCCFTSFYGINNYLKPVITSNMAARAMLPEPTAIDCPLRQRQPLDIGLTYAAILPGVDSNLISSILDVTSGLSMVNIDPSNTAIPFFLRLKGGPPEDETIIRHTAYPYTNHKQPPSYYTRDGRVSRAFIVIQNPLSVISDRFRSAAVKDWNRWKEMNLDREIALFHQFLCYWLDRNTPQQRAVMKYENLLSQQTGIETVMTITKFLGGHADVDAQCLSSIINNFHPLERRDALNKEQHPGNSTLIQEHIPEQQQLVPLLIKQYPFTALQLGKVTKMLEELAQRYIEEEQVHTILMQYHNEILTVMSQAQKQSEQNSELAMSASTMFTEPLQICGRSIPFPLESEVEVAQHYASQCPLFQTSGNEATKPTGLLLIRGYERFGRTGNNIIEFLHALQYGRENNVIVGIMLDSWPMALMTKFWMAFPTDNLHNDEFLSDGIIAWKDHIQQAFCIKVFLNEDELNGYDNVIEMTARELFMFRYKAEVNEYVQFQLHNIRMLFRSYNIGVGKDVKNRNVGNLCSVIDGVFGEERRTSIYSVIHSRSLEGAPGLRLLSILSGTSGCDPVAALNMEPEYIKAILAPVGLLNYPILFISDNQKPEILERLLADAEIGPQIRVAPKELSWVGGDLAVAIMADAFIGNPASTFSGFIAKSRIALGFDNNFLFRVKKDGEWINSCEDRCIFYKWVMRSMA